MVSKQSDESDGTNFQNEDSIASKFHPTAAKKVLGTGSWPFFEQDNKKISRKQIQYKKP